MPFSIVAAGEKLYKLGVNGLVLELVLPAGVSIDPTRRARFAVLGRNVIMVNGATRSLVIDPNFVVRPLILQPPTSPPILSASATGLLSGEYRVKYTNLIRDSFSGQIIAESNFSPISASSGPFTLKLLNAAGIAASPESTVTDRRLYRTTTGPGSTYYPWIELDGNVATSIADDSSDASLQMFSAEADLGTAPGMLPGTFMTLICQWKNRLWTVGDIDIDTLRYSADGKYYGWPALNAIPIGPVGGDMFGITGLIPRRDELGIAKRNCLWKLTGSGPSNFTLIKVMEGKGCWAPDSVCVIRDIGYFLGEDGVYAWDASGVNCISDEKVRGWFADNYYSPFNHAEFSRAFGKYNPQYHTYELHLCGAGSTNIDRWISYDIARKVWFGPHKTDALTPSIAGTLIDATEQTYPVIGGTNGYLYKQNQSFFAGFEVTDDGSAIVMSILSKWHAADTPDIHKLFGGMSMVYRWMGSPGNLRIGVFFEFLDTVPRYTIIPNLNAGQSGRARMRILGPGRFVRLQFTEDTNNFGCEIWGYEIPYTELGRR